MEDNKKIDIMKRHINKINEHFLKNGVMTQEQYAKISTEFICSLGADLI